MWRRRELFAGGQPWRLGSEAKIVDGRGKLVIRASAALHPKLPAKTTSSFCFEGHWPPQELHCDLSRAPSLHAHHASIHTSSHFKGPLGVNSLWSPSASLAVPGSEFKGRKRIPEPILPSATISPPPTPAPVAATPPRGPAEITSTFFLTRTGRE